MKQMTRNLVSLSFSHNTVGLIVYEEIKWIYLVCYSEAHANLSCYSTLSKSIIYILLYVVIKLQGLGSAVGSA